MLELSCDRIDSEMGEILLVVEGSQLCALDFSDCEKRMMALLRSRYKNSEISLKNTLNPMGLSEKIRAYLAGNLTILQEIPVLLNGTAFQQRVWPALREIPVGMTLSYQELAAKIGNPKAYRAVGMANSQNPIAIVIPCHRVIGANAKLTGYAGGLERKKWLLHHEGINYLKLRV